jgi:hypothetical protein
MKISIKQLIMITQWSNGFIGAITEVLGTVYDDPAYDLTQDDVTQIEAVYTRDFGTPLSIGTETVFGPMTPEMYMDGANTFYNQVVSANRIFGQLGFEFAKRDSTI